MYLARKNEEVENRREDIMFNMEVGLLQYNPRANKEAEESSHGNYYLNPLTNLLVSAATW
jgi:hypothetical protein